MASASAASSERGSALGSSTPIIMRTCALSPWPAPTMLFFTRFGAYSATGTPALRRHYHGDAARLAEFERRLGVLVDEGRLDRRLVGLKFVENARKPVVNGEQPHRKTILSAGRHRAAAEECEPVAGNLDDAPASAAEPRIDAENANRAAHLAQVIDPPPPAGKAVSLRDCGPKPRIPIMLDWSTCPAVERIPGKGGGEWLFKHSRVPVRALFENLEGGARIDEFLEWFPGVTREQVQLVLHHTEQSLLVS